MCRILFEKTGNAVYISHLDLMRLFQRAFKRSGLLLKHTQGLNPRPSVSIALPLSVGVSSNCELLDFELVGEPVACDTVHTELNQVLVDGVKVLSVYENYGKLRDLTYLDCAVTLEYDSGIPADTEEGLKALFSQETLMVEKRGKNGPVEQDIAPMIRKFCVEQTDDCTLTIHARVCCQNPTLNPMLIPAAIERYLPDCKPSFVRCCRKEIYNTEEKIFR